MKKSDAKKYAAALLLACEGKKKKEVDQIVQAFILHWGSRGQLAFLSSVAQEVAALDKRAQGREQVECRLAHCTEKTAHALTTALAHALKKDIDVTIIEDPSLIAGAVLTIGDTRVDGSVKARIAQLAYSLH